jgi:CheY-like chemotaxis protein/nitrogen-specific signal transduction histidine kinase
MPAAGSRKLTSQRARKTAQAKLRPKSRPKSRPLPRPKKSSVAKRQTSGVETALASLAHDIRTPLTGILALAELLAASDIGERERRWASGVKSAAEHLAQLTTIVCDAARADAAGLTLRSETFSPRRLAETIAASLSARAGTNGLTSEISIARDLPEQVSGDPVRLRAMIENLVDNAVKFTARGGLRFAASAKLAMRGKTRLIFAVTDSGIGISPAELKRLFRPFTQANDGVSRRFGGTGLGLAAVKRLAHAMDGTLSVTSKPKQGSTFTLSIPVGLEKHTVTKGNGAFVPVASAQMRSLKILCAEDNPYGRVILNTILTEFGHHADFVGSGEAAVEAVSRGGYDAVLMDVTLAGANGLEATRRIRALPGRAAKIPVIGLSALSSSADIARALQAGMNLYLTKPLTPVALADALAKLPTSRS